LPQPSHSLSLFCGFVSVCFLVRKGGNKFPANNLCPQLSPVYFVGALIWSFEIKGRYSSSFRVSNTPLLFSISELLLLYPFSTFSFEHIRSSQGIRPRLSGFPRPMRPSRSTPFNTPFHTPLDFPPPTETAPFVSPPRHVLPSPPLPIWPCP